MTREAFIKILDDKGYSYEIEGDKIVVTENGHVDLRSLTSLPPGVEFKNEGDVDFDALTSLPSGVVFSNDGSVNLESIKTLPYGVVLMNKGDVFLMSLTSISPGVEFKNGRGVDLDKLIGGWFHYWSGNIEGIDSKMLLNGMIKRSLFL